MIENRKKKYIKDILMKTYKRNNNNNCENRIESAHYSNTEQDKE